MSKKPVEKTKTKKRTRIMVFGTFDGLHRGHLNFLKQARELSERPFLIVSIARDSNVLKLKGKKPRFSEFERLLLLKKSRLAGKVVLSGKTKHLPHILKESPDIIALGYDQKAYIQNLKKDLAKRGVMAKIVRLKPYKQKIYKTHLIRRRFPGLAR